MCATIMIVITNFDQYIGSSLGFVFYFYEENV